MRLAIGKLALENFKSFTERQEVDLDAPGSGLHFMRGRNLVDKRLGSNGSGKSTLWDAITWCLYGRTAVGLRNTDVRAWKGSKKTYVSVEVFCDDKPHLIERTASPNTLKVDGKEAGQEAVDRLVGIGIDIFTQTILLAQSRPLFFDMQPREKMQMFVDVLSLDRWDKRASEASNRATELTSLLNDVETDLAAVGASIDELDAVYESTRRQSREWEDARQSRVADLTATIEQNEKLLEKVRERYEAADLKYDGALASVKLTEKDVIAASEAMAKARLALNTAKAERSMLERDLRKYERELDALGEGDRCSTCGQSLKGTALEKHQSELRKIIKDLKKDIDKVVPVKLEKDAEAADQRFSNLQAAQRQLQDEAREASADRDAAYPRMKEAEAVVKEARAALARGEKEDNPFGQQMQTLRRKIKKLEVEERELKSERKKCQSDLANVQFWVKGFKNIRLFIIEEALQELELTANAMLGEIGLVGWELQFAIEKETKSGTISRGINVTILSPANKEPVRWESWSGGEGQRLRIVGALALSEVLLNQANIIAETEILDEPTRHMSEEGVVDMCEFLADRARRLDKAIYYTDHMAVESVHFASVLTVEKTSKGSVVKS